MENDLTAYLNALEQQISALQNQVAELKAMGWVIDRANRVSLPITNNDKSVTYTATTSGNWNDVSKWVYFIPCM